MSDQFLHDYSAFVSGTSARNYYHLPNLVDEDILHAILGIATEAGELLDPVKKAFAYGRDVDFVNLDEEIGDVLWYIQLYCNVRGLTIRDLINSNVAKLSKRYENGRFTAEQAINRNLDAERAALEGKTDEQD